METIPVIAETGQALGLPLAVTLSLVIIAAVVITVIVLRDHRNRIDHMKEEISNMKTDSEKDRNSLKEEMAKQAAAHGSSISELKSEMARQAQAHNAELNALYKLINNVANDVSFIKGCMTQKSPDSPNWQG